MKKIFATILVIALMLLCLAGCSKDEVKEDAQNDIEIEETSDVEETEAEANTLTLEELTEEQIYIFEISASSFNSEVITGDMSIDEMDTRQEKLMDDYISMGDLPNNAVELFREWKASSGFYINLANKISGAENNKLTPEEEVEQKVESKPIVQNQNKPKPTEKQEQTQHKEVTQKPVKPSNNTPSDGEVVGTPGDVVSAGGGNGDNYTKAEDVIGDISESFSRALQSEAQRIASEQGISYEQALAQVKADWGV